ncbi:gastric triacylglycerol lipase-like [Uloborus diversus]|uniref:gastric triacylglycerol lipase-like n=1 Tax=Uloborus diversus TaxID=327109 RepID=UPI00240A6BBC|nr:gastric triacylglycerol lipase-like [Uloborus diversus]
MRTLILTLIVCSFIHASTARNIVDEIEILLDPDLLRNVSQLISSKGYPVEEHTVQTKDGYLLGLQRIPHGRTEVYHLQPRPVVFLQHGLLSAASDYVINFPEQSLGFILADAGYDVWLGNTRGNTYSRKHVKYTPKMKEFWEFSFDQMAQYDLPAMIDYVLKTSGQAKLNYVGHSQGTSAAFALLSENPEYNKKVKLFIALAPVTTVGYITSAIKYLAPFTKEIDFLFEILGIGEFLPNNVIMKYLSELVCEKEIRYLCEDVMFLMFGTDKAELNQTRIGVYSAHTPAGSSTQSVVHYAQLVNSKTFQKYDYGKKGNMKHYNQTTPPQYDVSKITAPVALIWSMNDALADPVDVDILIGKLKSMVSNYCVPFPLFNHQDFVLAVDTRKLLYDHLLQLLKKFERIN